MTVPPLRDRVEDIPLLLEHFVKPVRAGVLHGAAGVHPGGTGVLLMRHSWPGNVRELKNLVERLTVRQPGERQ